VPCTSRIMRILTAEVVGYHMTQRLERRCRNEVIELHRFFADWYNGAIDETDELFSRLEMALGEGLLLISPDGRKTLREPLLAGLRRAYGSHQHDPSPFRIWIRNLNVTPLGDGIALVTYEEWQQNAGKTTARLSSALFRHQPERPNGVEWLHVHETWLARDLTQA
jgi:hypothetical protein